MGLQAAASMPDGPAEPLPRTAVFQKVAPVMLSKITGWHSGVWSVLVDRACWSTVCDGGCFSFRASSTVPVDGLQGYCSWSSGSTLPRPSFVRRRSAVHVFPASINFENELARLSSFE